ncbi:nucleotide-diphospho-sugar transferase [Amylostereum chailletii]|nr:nucleotide-diphospho-sugar transferase [Amylostereum chailletii]
MAVNGAFVTLITKDEYLPGALVVHAGMVKVKSKYPFVALVTPTLSEDARGVLERRGVLVHEVSSLIPPDGTKPSDHDARFADTWTKLRAFELEEYKRVVMLDSDMLVRRNIDDLMELKDLPDDWIAAAHACTCNPRGLKHYPADWIPQNCAYTPLLRSETTMVPEPSAIEPSSPRTYALLNSGLVVLTPSAVRAKEIEDFIRTSELVPNFKFPDQDLLAEVFRGKWKPLPWTYNGLKTLRNIHEGLWHDDEVRLVHYILHDKPWLARIEKGEEKEAKTAEMGDAKDMDDYTELHWWWWQALDALVADLKESDPLGYNMVTTRLEHLSRKRAKN